MASTNVAHTFRMIGLAYHVEREIRDWAVY